MITSGGFALTLGLHLSADSARNPSATVQGVHLSPRFAFEVPLSRKKTSAFRFTAGRYYHVLPLSDLAWGNPDAPGALAYEWRDSNGDGSYSGDELGRLLRREGPLYGAIDPDLRRPSTDEISLSITHDLGRGWLLSLAGYLREARNLIETINTGVPSSAYAPVSLYDEGDDRIPGSIDDLLFTVFDQKADTLGRDFFLLTNPGRASRASTYKGLDLVLTKRLTAKSLFFLALTATQAWQTNGPGNTEEENDDGVLAGLYDDPNASINARGRPRFDRAYTARLGLSLALPLDTAFGAVVKYYDGQPFTRMIIVRGLTQGPFLIQAHPRGVARYEFNMTVDLRLEKKVRLAGTTLRLLVDVFNAFNQNLATTESPWTSPEFPLRFATEVQSPRVWRVGLNFEF
jgi:hypothetical protein